MKMHLQEVGWGGMDWIGLAQVRDRWWSPVNTVKSQKKKRGVFLDWPSNC